MDVAAEQTPSPAEPPRSAERPPEREPRRERAAGLALALLPGGLVAYFGFGAGGYFPGSVGFAALLLIQALILRLLLAEDPLAGVGRRLTVVAALFAAYVGWTLLSGLWSESAARPLIEFDRALVYLVVLVLMGTLPRHAWRIGVVVRGLTAGCFAVCSVALVSRVLPHVWPTSPGVANNRLSYPVTYWNALGLLAAIGTLLALGLTCSDREPPAGRALAAAALPVFATTLLFTFSRGGIIALVVGVVVFLSVARQRGVVGGLIATVPPTLIALLFAYGADHLASPTPTSPAAVDQGKHVALAVVLCAAAAAVARLAVTPLEQRAARVVAAAGSRGVVRAGLAATALAGVALALALGGAAWLHDEVHDFLKAPPGKATDLRQRLTDPSSSGRTEHWRVAFEGFAEARVKGHGAGSYEFLWDAKRRLTTSAVDAHGLYFETLAELGIVGLVLLVAPLLAIVAAFALLAVGRNRSIYAALLGAGVAWAVHAGYDWDWEMPVTTAWLFAAGGAALARRGTERVRKQQPLAHGSRRYLICAGLLATAVAPALLTLSQAHLARSANAFNARNCRAADREALASISALADRPEPYQILGYCDMADGRPQAAIAAMQKAIRKEPDSWEYRYGLALARAEAGTDPHEDLADAAVRSPRETLIRQATQVFAGPGSPTRWQREAERMRITTVESGQLTLK